MPRYNFEPVCLAGNGDTPEAAWQNAIEALNADPGEMPEFTEDTDSDDDDG